MYPRSLSVGLALTLIGSCPLAAQTPPQETTSITHVTVVDVATGKKLPDQTVALQGDRIISVSATDSASAPPGRVIEAHGKSPGSRRRSRVIGILPSAWRKVNSFPMAILAVVARTSV